MTLEEFEAYLTRQMCWLDGAPTHASHAGQRQCRHCRRKWSYLKWTRYWRLAQLFCAPSGKGADCGRHHRRNANNLGRGPEFTVGDPVKQVIDRIHAAVLLKESGRVAGRTISRARKRKVNAAAVGRIYTEFEQHMLVDYFFAHAENASAARKEIIRLAKLPPASSADDEALLMAALQRIAMRDRRRYRGILESALDCIWKTSAEFGGYKGRLRIIYRRFIVPRLREIRVPA